MALKILLLFLVLTSLMAYATAARNLAESRLEASECGKALQELNSCSNLTVQFFLTGRADIANCCSAIADIIKSKCNWPAALTSLGYALEEANIIKAYCNASPPPSLLKGTITMQSFTTISTVTNITI